METKNNDFIKYKQLFFILQYYTMLRGVMFVCIIYSIVVVSPWFDNVFEHLLT